MPTGHKKETNVVKIQVEAKQPRAPRRRKHKKAKVQKIKFNVPKLTMPKELTENMVMMQKVMVILAEKMDNLAKQTSELLRLFESAAKTFIENPALAGRDKEMLDKINQLLEQDRLIARGVIYVEEKVNKIDKDVDIIMAVPSARPAPAPVVQASAIPAQQPAAPAPSQEEYQASQSQ
ncbi:MAG: hypothetical protein MUF61_00410 [archaeon]|jgi:hypothetical protein|nr:hypothetical protein [archaeon]